MTPSQPVVDRRHPRRRLALLPTPLHRLAGLEAVLDCGPVLLKRDDLVGFGLAGNKARPLEYLIGDALSRRADVLVTGGAPGSNFIGAAALAARVAGLQCELVVADAAPTRLPVALELARQCGAELHFAEVARQDVDYLIAERAEQLRRLGACPYPVVRGGADPVGALGFANAAAELADQLRPLGLNGATVVLPTGSGASLAGLLAGRAAIGATWPVVGVSVSRPVEEMQEQVHRLAVACAGMLGGPAPVRDDVRIVDATGLGFGRLTHRDVRWVRTALHAEGVLFDATYGAKALGVLVEEMAERRGPAVLWHTGGLPSAMRLLADPGHLG